MALFQPKPGCPMCSIVQAASITPANIHPGPIQNTSRASHPEILWKDNNFTAYLEKNNPVSSKGHIVVLFNLHVPSIYSLSSADLPLLVQIQRRAPQLLRLIHRPSSHSPDLHRAYSPVTTSGSPLHSTLEARVGFITSPFRDNKIPVTDHLHAHAYLGPPDLAGWWRGLAYGSLSWYAIDDLIAEIRESTSNNRIRSGHPNRGTAPIDLVPQAGARSGMPNGLEITEQGLAVEDLEEGNTLAPTPSPRPAAYSSSSLLLPGAVS